MPQERSVINKRYFSSYKGSKGLCQRNIRKKGDKDFIVTDHDWKVHWESTECRICGVPLPVGTNRRKHFDHKHGGAYRGTLCEDCNRGLGSFKDNPEILENAIKYLGGIR